ncbi:MAG TPA: hypothetical protein VLL52_25985 [Anaerolineae bacterium]|nr:hypothetical protein [Anaerolineae bacterium]
MTAPPNGVRGQASPDNVRGHDETSRATLIPAGRKMWREYRRVGPNTRRYPRDRWWYKTAEGGWKKRSRHRRDIPSLTEAQYEQWKARRRRQRQERRQGAG